MRAIDERYTKELRRSSLALHFLRRKVRTKTICEWTHLSRGRVDKIRKAHRHEFPDVELTRPHGPSPKALGELLKTPEGQCEAAALGGICKAFGIVPKEPMPDARRYLPSVTRGENLCCLHDAFCTLVPGAEITLEHLLWLSLALADGERRDIGRCECAAAILVDPLDIERKRCFHCAEEHVPRRRR